MHQFKWALVVAAFVVLTRVGTVFPVLYKMKQGLRAAILPAIHLSQVSELSLVLIALGAGFGHITTESRGVMAYAFVILAVASSYAISRTDRMLPRLVDSLRRAGFRDLNSAAESAEDGHAVASIYLLGFSWTASSLIEEVGRHAPDLLKDIVVVDFNPNVHKELRARGQKVIYGDITQRDTLLHAGVGEAELIVCSLPNTVLKGCNNLRLLQQLREINPTAQIIMHAELFADVPKLYEAGASYVSVPRLIEAQELCEVIQAARLGGLDRKRQDLHQELTNRHEVIP
jgi:hypothetical protein